MGKSKAESVCKVITVVASIIGALATAIAGVFCAKRTFPDEFDNIRKRDEES